MNVEIYHKW